MAEINEERVNTLQADDGTKWVEIASTGSEDEATILRGFLQNEGINAEIEAVKFTMEPVTFGAMGEIRVFVPQEFEAQAMELMRQREAMSQKLDDDEDTLITHEGEAVVDESATVEKDNEA